MNNEKNKILKMLENGEISSDEASKLLSILENVSSNKNKENSFINNSNSNNNNNGDRCNSNNKNSSTFSKLDVDLSNILDKVNTATSTLVQKGTGIFKIIEKEVKTAVSSIPKKSTPSNKQSFYKEFNFETSDYDNSLNLKSLNGEMILKGYNGNKLTVKIIYIPTSSSTNINISNTMKDYNLIFDESAFEKVSIEVLIPSKCFKSIKLIAYNSNFCIDGLEFGSLNVNSLNSNCIVENCLSDYMFLDGVDSKFIVRNTISNKGEIYNVSNFVKLNNIDIKELKVDVINSDISLVNGYLNKFKDYLWYLEAQNNTINIEINTDDINYDIDATSNLGKISILKHNLDFSTRTDSKVIAKSNNTTQLFKYLNLEVKNTNADIVII